MKLYSTQKSTKTDLYSTYVGDSGGASYDKLRWPETQMSPIYFMLKL